MQNGSLAVPNGRAILPTINLLLSLPFVLKVATKDWHPIDHVSFASNHPNAKPYTSFTTIHNPSNPSESYKTRLWPVHCVQGTPGAALVKELDTDMVDRVVEKGQDPRVEMYSAFYDPLKEPRVSDSGLAGALSDVGATHVYVVGLAADYCVKFTAVDAASEGFETYIIEEATRAVDDSGWGKCKKELATKKVKVVSMEGEEVKRIILLGQSG
jgi:nicotinamidase-related amidase